MMEKNKAFTLIEVMAVVVIVSILAAFSIPAYQKAARKASERAATANLLAMKSGVEFYLVNSGNAVIPNWTDLNAINAGLGIRISDPRMTYQCWGINSGDTNTCRATSPDGWVLHFHDEHSGEQIHCLDGTCPSCPPAPGNCEG